MASKDQIIANQRNTQKSTKSVVKIRAHSCKFVVQPKYENKAKTNPKQSQTKPFFWWSIFNFSLIIKILDKFRQTFFMQNKAILSKLHPEYETPKKTNYAKRTQS